MKNTVKCGQCGKNDRKEDTYIFEGQTYCHECGIPLLYALADYGLIDIEFEDCEKKCIRVHGQEGDK